MPRNSAIFLSGTLVLPDLAGMIAMFDTRQPYNKYMGDTDEPRSHEARNLTPLSVALVGLGKIGFQNDFRQSIDATLTHYSSLAKFSHVSIIAGIDTNEKLCDEFTTGTNIKTYKKVSELNSKIDLAVISASTSEHLELVGEAIDYLKPKIIICEKPMGLNSDEAKKIAGLARSNSVNLYIPYLRRYMPHIKELSKEIEKKRYGKIIEVSVEYGQGLLTNGSHFVNLVDYLVGGLNTEVSLTSKTNSSNPSWIMSTPENAFVKFQGSSAVTRAGEIRIRCESGEYVLLHGGIVTYFGAIEPESGWLEQPSNFQISDWRLGMRDFYVHVLSNTARDMKDVKEDLDSAIRTQEIVTKVLG